MSRRRKLGVTEEALWGNGNASAEESEARILPLSSESGS